MHLDASPSTLISKVLECFYFETTKDRKGNINLARPSLLSDRTIIRDPVSFRFPTWLWTSAFLSGQPLNGCDCPEFEEAAPKDTKKKVDEDWDTLGIEGSRAKNTSPRSFTSSKCLWLGTTIFCSLSKKSHQTLLGLTPDGIWPLNYLFVRVESREYWWVLLSLTCGQNFSVPLKTLRTEPTAPFKSLRKNLYMIWISGLYDRGIRS